MIYDSLILEPVNGIVTSGSKILPDGTIQHTLFLDDTNNPYISITYEKVNMILQIFEKCDNIHINVFEKIAEKYFRFVESYSYNIFEVNSTIPLLYVSICNVITNNINKHKARIVQSTNTVLTFKELLTLEKFFKSRKKFNISFGNTVIYLDCNNYSDLDALSNAIIYQLDAAVS